MSKYLSISELNKTYKIGPKSLHVLRDLNLEVKKGEMVAITGHSGSGKTTLLHILGTLDLADSGIMEYGGTDLSQIRGVELERFRNSEIGFVFQFFQLLPEFSALENVVIPQLISGLSKTEAKMRATEILGEVGLKDRLNHMPSQLSGGEQQRAAIARALVNKPNLLLADEPTGNLDTATGDRVFSLLRELQKKHNLTSIIVTHNPDIAGKCDRILSMEDINGE